MSFPLRPQDGESYSEWLVKALLAVAMAGLIAKLYAMYGPGPVLFTFIALFLLVVIVSVFKGRRTKPEPERLQW